MNGNNAISKCQCNNYSGFNKKFQPLFGGKCRTLFDSTKPSTLKNLPRSSSLHYLREERCKILRVSWILVSFLSLFLPWKQNAELIQKSADVRMIDF